MSNWPEELIGRAQDLQAESNRVNPTQRPIARFAQKRRAFFKGHKVTEVHGLGKEISAEDIFLKNRKSWVGLPFYLIYEFANTFYSKLSYDSLIEIGRKAIKSIKASKMFTCIFQAKWISETIVQNAYNLA